MSAVSFRDATLTDLPEIVRMLAADELGASRERFEDPLPEPYRRAFAAIEADARNRLIVAEVAGRTVGTMQITYIPSLSHQGSERAMLEAVRIDSSTRGSGLGSEMRTWAIEQAKARGCRLIQLTTDKRRLDAHRFYERLGFVASHEGMKLTT